MDKLTSTFMKKHLTLFNKLVRNETYKGVSKMKIDGVRKIFKRDFKLVNGRDGRNYYSPKKADVEIDENDENLNDRFKLLSHPKGKKKEVKKEAPLLTERKGKKKAVKITELKPKKEVKKEEPKKSTKDKVKKIRTELNDIEKKVFNKKYDLRNLKKIIKNKDDINKINEEIQKIQKSRIEIQKKLNPLINEKFLKDNPQIKNDLVVDKEQYERRLKLIMKNLRKLFEQELFKKK